MRKATVLAILALALSSGNICATTHERVVEVAGTSLQHMHTAFDVLTHVPGVTYANEVFHVTAYGKPDIYIGQRKLNNYNELKQMPANYVKNVKVITSPGAQYGKNVQAVMVIELIDEQAERLSLNNNLGFTMSHFFAPSDELTLTYKRSTYSLGAMVGITEERSRTHEESFTNSYDKTPTGYKLYSRQHELDNPYKHAQTLSGKLFAEYLFSPDHKLAFHYYIDWKRRNDNNKYYDITNTYDANEQGVIVQDTPTTSDSVMSFQTGAVRRNELNFEYTGKVGKVSLYAGNNTTWNTTFSNTSKYHVVNLEQGTQFSQTTEPKSETLSRSYLAASLPLGHGTVSAGSELTLRNTDIKFDDSMQKRDCTHGDINEDNYAVYAQAQQTFGNWTVAAGVRYEMSKFSYKAQDDDDGARLVFPQGFKFNRDYDHVYPNAMVAYTMGDNKFTLSYDRSYNRFNMANIRIRIMPSFTIENYMLHTERISTTTLSWARKWMSASINYRHYDDPLCHTTSGSVDYNGNSYDALDVNLNLSPTVGLWTPAFTANLHKQWFEMLMSNGNTKLNTPMLTMQLNNTFALPQGWFLHVNGNWHSKGYDRNVRYYSNNFQLDASVQKNFLDNKLSVEFIGTNLLRNSWDDVTIYTDHTNGANKGHKNLIQRVVALSMRYTL
ncbi:MAG: outer membrane beta-barrel family protein [Muribaculaceae bacterium]|nr:outer membrane beta-barrel family protein [Muribaculaceae bacterium]